MKQRCKIWADEESERFLKQVQQSLGIENPKSKRIGLERVLHHVCENYQPPLKGDRISVTFGDAFIRRKLR